MKGATGFVARALPVALQHQLPLLPAAAAAARLADANAARAPERAGFHYCTTLLHKVQMALKLETDPSEVLNELIYCCRKVPCPAL